MADLTMHRGDSLVLNIAVADPDTGDPVNLTGATLRLTAKRSLKDADSDAIVVLTTGTGITVTDASGGLAEAEIEPDATDDLGNVTLALAWDLQLTTTEGRVFTVASGTLTITPDVSRTTP